MKNLFEKVQKLLKEGKSRVEIANILDCQKSTVNYYANPEIKRVLRVISFLNPLIMKYRLI